MNTAVVRMVTTRALLAVGTLFVVSAVVFFGTQLLPGNPALAALGGHAQPQAVRALERQFNLDRPPLQRYGDWLSGFVRGNLGESIPSGEPVWGLISDEVGNTATLTVGALIVLIPFAFALGIASAVKKDRLLDHGIAIPSLIVGAMPEFVIGTFLVVIVAVWLGLLPPVSLVTPGRSIISQANLFVLPVLTLVGTTLAQVTRMVRAVTLEVLESDYVAMARLKGLSEARVLLHHVLPNALGPTIQTIALNAAWLVGGVVVTETVFQLPGIGLALVYAVETRDIPTVEAIAMIVTAAYLGINLLADITVIVLNPRLRAGQ